MNPHLVYTLREQIVQNFPSLGKWQAIGLSLICIGLMLSKDCALRAIADCLPEFGSFNTVRQRLKRWLRNDHLQVDLAFEDWVRWVYGAIKIARPVLLVDETKLGDCIGVMMVSVAYGNRAIPLVWRCYYANQKEDYPQQGQVLMIYGLLAHVLSQLPLDVCPVVEMDRGLAHSSAMLRALYDLKVDFLVRVKQNARFTTLEGETWLISDRVQQGQHQQFEGWLFGRDHRVPGTLSIIWDVGQKESWCLFSNDPKLSGRRYALRWWQEESFKDLKSGGWQWESSQIRCPRRMERLVLVMAIAYGLMIGMGSEVHTLPEAEFRTAFTADDRQRYSLFRLGLRWFQHLRTFDPKRLRMKLIFAPPAALVPFT